jgi:transposase, IS6 family
MATRPVIFKWRQTEPVLILCAVRWYLRYSRSLRDVEELLEEARSARRPYDRVALGAAVRSRAGAAHAAASQADQQIWRVDETYIRVQGRWCYLYRAIDFFVRNRVDGEWRGERLDVENV